MANIKLTVAYDGTDFLGWQMTSMGPSIEEAIKVVLERILQHDVHLQAASRTDAGVHAIGQVVNFTTERDIGPLGKLKVSLNSLLPKAIAVTGVEIVDDSFHPTLDSVGKEYHYFICYGTAQLPHHRYYSWHYPKRLDVALMRDAAKILEGQHDFSTFCNVKKNHSYTDYERNIKRIEIIELGYERVRIEIQGNNFLYKMVRNLVGTIAYVGSGKIALSSIPEILAGHSRPLAGVTAPACGLFLHRVLY